MDLVIENMHSKHFASPSKKNKHQKNYYFGILTIALL